MIHRTEFITFPRSGHHLLIAVLQRYFGTELKYCEKYEQPELRFDQCPETNAMKNHDFELDTALDESRRYVVQVRDPLESIASYFELKAAEGAAPDREKFCKEALDYWSRWTAKWVYSPVPTRLIVHYRNLLDHPLPVLVEVVEHVSDGKAEVQRLRDVIEAAGLRSHAGLRPRSVAKLARVSVNG